MIEERERKTEKERDIERDTERETETETNRDRQKGLGPRPREAERQSQIEQSGEDGERMYEGDKQRVRWTESETEPDTSSLAINLVPVPAQAHTLGSSAVTLSNPTPPTPAHNYFSQDGDLRCQKKS